MTLIANMQLRTSADSIHAFGTPTVVHLGTALIISATLSAPWPSLFPVSVALMICGIGGLGYGALVIRRARRQTGYKPVWEDWLWYCAFPCKVYAAVILAAVFMPTMTQLALFLIGGAALGLLLIAIHKSQDDATKTE
jgi:hypothetical protein